MRKCVIDDTRLDDADYRGGYLGDPILFTNQDIRRMLKLAKVGKNDIFMDLGCGWGQNLIIALTEFNVKYAIGFEKNKKRYRKAVSRIKKLGLSNRCTIINKDFLKVLKAKRDSFGIGNATVVYYGLSTDEETLGDLKKWLRQGCRLLYYYLCVFPEIMPERADFPFYVSRVPFKETISERDWLLSIVQKEKSSINKGKPSSSEELWCEMHHDYDVWGDRTDVTYYKRWIARYLRKKKQRASNRP